MPEPQPSAETPAALGFRMPAEWEPHAATWLAWPHNPDDWPGKFEPVCWAYVEIVRALTRHEPVNLIVPTDPAAGPGDRLSRAGIPPDRVRLWTLPTDRSWVRDCGPTFVVNDRGQRAVLDWHFTAWAKYPNWTRDDRIPEVVAAGLGLPRWQPTCRGHRVVLEGGGLDVNGAGTLLTTEECLLGKTQERNPAMGRHDYERVFADYLGVRKVIWLGRGIVGDDTHGHVDDLARFVNPTTVVSVVENDPRDENYEALQENLERLRGASAADGRPLTVVPLPMPRPLVFDGVRLPASYANFYIANGVVIVPTFNDPADRVALATLAELFPGREVVGIHSVDLVWGLGTLHCLTQQEPAGAVARP
jgi:agmatine deiminase